MGPTEVGIDLAGIDVDIVTGSENRGLVWVLERSAKSGAAADWENSLAGASSDVATRMRNVPALRFDNPNPAGRNVVRFDGVDPDNVLIVIDRKLNVTTKPDQIRKFMDGPLNALRQNPEYLLRIEVPSTAAQANAERLLRIATQGQGSSQVIVVLVK